MRIEKVKDRAGSHWGGGGGGGVREGSHLLLCLWLSWCVYEHPAQDRTCLAGEPRSHFPAVLSRLWRGAPCMLGAASAGVLRVQSHWTAWHFQRKFGTIFVTDFGIPVCRDTCVSSYQP